MAPSDIDTPESDENNEKTQQQEATPAQLKSDKETTALKQKTTKGGVSSCSCGNSLSVGEPLWLVASPLFSSLGVWLFANVRKLLLKKLNI
jgi:hypothetical protein